MKSVFTYRCIMLLALSVLPACSKESPSSPPQQLQSKTEAAKKIPRHEQYLQWHTICQQGNTDKIDQQIAKFEAVLKKSPKDNLARAYLGSAYALKAKHSFFPTTKLNSLKKGKALMEAAVKSSPNNPRVRMVRAIAYFKVPERFKTHLTSLADFEKLLREIKQKDSSLATNEKQAILYFAYLAFSEHKHAQALEAKQRCHKIDPHSKYGKLTR